MSVAWFPCLEECGRSGEAPKPDHTGTSLKPLPLHLAADFSSRANNGQEGWEAKRQTVNVSKPPWDKVTNPNLVKFQFCTSCVNLGKFLSLSEPPFLTCNLENVPDSELLRGLNKFLCIEGLE